MSCILFRFDLFLRRCSLCKDIVTLVQSADKPEVTGIVSVITKEVCLLGKGGFGYSCDGEFACNNLCTGVSETWPPLVTFIVAQLAADPTSDCQQLGFCSNDTLMVDAQGGSSSVPFRPVA